MSTPTLAQRRGLARYLQVQADTRTAGQLKHGERDWSRPQSQPIAQINARPAPKPVPVWITFALSAICLVAVTYAVGAFAAWVFPIVWSWP